MKKPFEPDREWLSTPHEDHARLRMILTTARTDEEIMVSGNLLEKLKYDGSYNGCYIKLDHRHAPKLYMREIKRIKRRYSKIYLTNTAQTGKELILGITHVENCEIIGEDKSSLIPDNNTFTSGRDGIEMVGGYYDETGMATVNNGYAGVAKITSEREIHVRAMPPQMLTDRLTVEIDAATDTIAAPGAHYALEILGYEIQEYENAAFQVGVSAKLKFETSSIWVWEGLYLQTGVVTVHKSEISGLRIRGAENEVLTLTNADRDAGMGAVLGIIYYQKVRIN